MNGLVERPRIVTSKKTTTIQLGHALQRIERTSRSGLQKAISAPETQAVATADQMQAEYERGRDEARRELAHAYGALNALVAGVKRESAEMLGVIDRHATVLALSIAARILDREVAHPDVLQNMIAAALAQVPSHEKLTIRLNPADRVVLEKLRNDNAGGHALLPPDAALAADPEIRRGGCMIESSIGTLDARLETQLRLIEQALLADRKADSPDAQLRTDS